MTEVMSMQKVKVKGQGHRGQNTGPLHQFELTYDEMMHKALCCLGEVPYCFSRTSVKFPPGGSLLWWVA